MGLLDGGLQALFGAALSPLYLDGTLYRPTIHRDGEGGTTRTFASAPVKVQVEAYSDAYRAATGIPATDVRLIVLQSGVSPAPDTDGEITARGARYKVVAIDEDPAQAAWIIRGRPA